MALTRTLSSNDKGVSSFIGFYHRVFARYEAALGRQVYFTFTFPVLNCLRWQCGDNIDRRLSDICKICIQYVSLHVLSTTKLIQELEQISPNGFQVSVRTGVLNSTKAIYFHQSLIYLFNMEDDFKFKSQYGYKIDEFLEAYVNQYWEVECIIS